MLVYFSKCLILEGEHTRKVKRWLFGKAKEARRNIYLRLVISGYCDESDVNTEVERLTKKAFNNSGWGKDFSGWQRTLTAADAAKLVAKRRLEKDYIPEDLDGVYIEHLNDWTVKTAMEKLTAEQFAKYLKDYSQVNISEVAPELSKEAEVEEI